MPATYVNCAVHTWPHTHPGGSSRAVGSIEYQQCNNCLALKIKFTTHIQAGTGWLKVEQEQLIEPAFTAPVAVLAE